MKHPGLHGLAWLFAIVAPVRAAAEPPDISTGGALLQGLIGLVIVLGALAAFFWFLRRFSPGQSGAQGVVKVVGGVMLGPRERLVVVVNDKFGIRLTDIISPAERLRRINR